MKSILSNNVQVGQKIKTLSGWKTVKKVTGRGAETESVLIEFGQMIYGWKAR